MRSLIPIAEQLDEKDLFISENSDGATFESSKLLTIRSYV